jgi:hypothetical protein
MIGYSLISIAFILAIDFGKIKMLHLVCFVGAYPETQYVPDVICGYFRNASLSFQKEKIWGVGGLS